MALPSAFAFHKAHKCLQGDTETLQLLFMRSTAIYRPYFFELFHGVPGE